jgi:hypothetical protein
VEGRRHAGEQARVLNTERGLEQTRIGVRDPLIEYAVPIEKSGWARTDPRRPPA